MEKVFFHVDLDAFFASVEQLDHPEYRGKPVIVGGKPGEPRGVVSTASYEARKYGVHSAMPTVTAYKLCPEGIFVHGNYKRYSEKSEEVMSIFKNYSPDVQQMSIDEAFLDMTGTEKLFGKPRETALKLKQEIKEKTGLTVSIGIAANKYIAKIASGLNKPDGLTEIAPGTEEQFMLNLPLDKVWGVGKKTYERLISLQLKTTREIHTRSLSILQNLMGVASGQFIYNAVRGLEAETFTSETKNHSISAENTFETDLTYSDQFEYALLELSQVVFFRILKEKVKSKTVHLKIRYDDFTTVSIQETFSSYISSSDDLFAKVKSLFAKKYIINHGVRLLGVGLSNVESSQVPSQGELFDFGEKNKAKVEEAILKATEKNPGIKITKASLLKKFCIIAAAGLLFLSPQKSYSQTVTETERNTNGASSIVFNTRNISPYYDKNKTSVFNYDINDSEIEFLAGGWWQSSFSKMFTMSTGFNTATAAESPPSIFSQKVDLDLWLMINRHWYFETAFAENFDRNTIAAGYTGNGLVKDLRIANRGIVFPSVYSIDDMGKGAGGGNNSAPGIHLKMGSENFTWDTILRYDTVESCEKTWQGKNSVSTENLSLSDWHTGYRYALPLDSAASIKDIYVEKYDGSFTKIDHNYFLTRQTEKDSDTLYLSQDAKAGIKNGKLPKVIVEFNSTVNLGQWNNSNTFLGKVQEAFGDISLEKFAYEYGSGTNRITIQSPDGFSPFVYANLYDTGITPASDAKIASRTTETSLTKFDVELEKESTSFVTRDFISQNHVFATVYSNEAEQTENSALTRFPLAKDDPAIYLGYNPENDFVLRIRTLTKVNRLDIGSRAIPGTVKVYRNGTLDNGAKYDEESGTITLSGTIHESDHIIAKWYEDSENSENGSITFASGIEFNILPSLTGDFSAVTKWNYNPSQNYSTTQSESPGEAVIASKLSWNSEKLSVKNTAAVSIQKSDTYGTLRLLSMENDRETFYLSKAAASNLPENIVPALTGFTEILEKEKDGTLNASKGHKDSEISGYAIPVSWNFNSTASSITPNWAAVSIATPGISSTLKTATNFSIAVKSENLPSDTKVFIQLGVQDNDDFKYESSFLPVWEITDQLTPGTPQWKTVTVNLSNEQKSRIRNNTSIRFIVTSTSVQTGTIYAGPYKTDGTLFNVEENTSFTVSMANEQDPSLKSSKIRELNSSRNYVQFINYKTVTGSKLSVPEEIKFFTFFEETDISLYKKATIWIKKDSSLKGLRFDFTRPENTGAQIPAIKAELTQENIASIADDAYFSLTFDLQHKTAKISNVEIPLFVNTAVVPSKLTVTLISDESGSFALDELIFTDPVSSFNIENKTQVKYKTAAGIFRQLKLASTLTESYSEMDTKKSNKLFQTQNSFETATDLLHAQITASTSSTGRIVPQGSHNLKISKLFGSTTVSESYSYSDADSVFVKHNTASFDFTNSSAPVKINLDSATTKDLWSNSQNMTGQISIPSEPFSTITQIILSQQDYQTYDFERNYFEAYKDILKYQFSEGSESNSKRTAEFSENITFKIPYTKIKPQFVYNLKQNYRNTNQSIYTNSVTTSLNIPVSLGSNSFSISWSKQGSSEETVSVKDSYKKDLSYLYENQSNLLWYYKAFPAADLTGTFISKKDYNQVSYSGLYRLGWKRNFSATKYDFFIPSGAGFNLSRDITLSSSKTDLYQYQTYASFAAMNVFGKTGTVHLFDCFEHDTWMSNFQAAVKMPSNSLKQARASLSGYILSDFQINESNMLKNALEGSFDDKTEWNARETLTYSRRADSSILASFASLFTDIPQEEFIITRKDSLNLTFSHNEDLKKQLLQYLHSADVQINKFVTLNSDIEFSYDSTWNKIIYLNLSGTLGITVKF